VTFSISIFGDFIVAFLPLPPFGFLPDVSIVASICDKSRFVVPFNSFLISLLFVFGLKIVVFFVA
jgi:hypothetical protein